MQLYNFACGSLRVWNLVSHIKGGTWTEGVWEKCAEEGILIEESEESRENCITRSFVICTLRQVLLE
jgi:hypothetical protein